MARKKIENSFNTLLFIFIIGVIALVSFVFALKAANQSIAESLAVVETPTPSVISPRQITVVGRIASVIGPDGLHRYQLIVQRNGGANPGYGFVQAPVIYELTTTDPNIDFSSFVGKYTRVSGTVYGPGENGNQGINVQTIVSTRQPIFY